MGFAVSATAIQRNTEATGARIDDRPYRVIREEKRHERCELMVVEMDGTMSPQIHKEEGVTGRESLKQPTEYKECNLSRLHCQFFESIKQQNAGSAASPRVRRCHD